MTDYNDGKWHGWNGGECPVDPESIIDVHYINAVGGYGRGEDRLAGQHSWALSCLFRITKPAPPKPRTMWGVGLHLHPTLETAREFLAALAVDYPEMNFGPITEWTEVLPSTQTQGD